MADERKYFVLCANNCKFESMTKEQILTAIEQAISTGAIYDVDTGFVTKIKEQNSGAALSFWVGTQAQYNAISEKANNCFYIITDDTTAEDINIMFAELQQITGLHSEKIVNIEAEIGYLSDTVEQQKKEMTAIETNVDNIGANAVITNNKVKDAPELNKVLFTGNVVVNSGEKKLITAKGVGKYSVIKINNRVYMRDSYQPAGQSSGNNPCFTSTSIYHFERADVDADGNVYRIVDYYSDCAEIIDEDTLAIYCNYDTGKTYYNTPQIICSHAVTVFAYPKDPTLGATVGIKRNYPTISSIPIVKIVGVC